MNILHIISGGEAGGSKTHLLTLAQNIKFSGFRSIIVCFMEGELYNDALNMGLDIRLVKQKGRFDLTIVNKLKKICVTEDIDIINCHGGRANFVGIFLKLRYDAKYASTIHSDYKDDYRGNKLKTLIFSNVNRMALKGFNDYITVSHNFKDMLIERGFRANKIHVVYNGIDFKREKGKFNRDDIIFNNGLIGASHFVSMIARFHPVKGHTVFLDACKKVLDKYNDVVFILAGDGEIREDLKKYVEDLGINNKVYFAGFRNPDEFLFLSDFTVLASYTESFPLCILESALFEKTVVATKVGGLDKLIENDENGFLVEVGDSDAMASRIVELLKDSEKCELFGKNLYEKARANYSIEKMVENYIEIYKDIDGGIFI
jgi:L-malate glycosyltransferase